MQSEMKVKCIKQIYDWVVGNEYDAFYHFNHRNNKTELHVRHNVWKVCIVMECENEYFEII